MSDRDDSIRGTDEPAFDDPAFDQLRALLADARATEPVPAEVAARLEDTLSALQEERRAESVVVPMRRRAAARVLVAAAAVVVIGAGSVGVAQMARHGSGASDNNVAADSAKSGGGTEAYAPTEPGADTDTPAPVDGLSALAGKAVPRFTTDRFAEQVETAGIVNGYLARDDSLDKAATRTPESVSPSPTTADSRAQIPCPGPTIADTESVPILLDGRPAVLVVHAVTEGMQQYDAWSCDGKTELTTATVTR